jgi:hypothetical protein
MIDIMLLLDLLGDVGERLAELNGETRPTVIVEP